MAIYFTRNSEEKRRIKVMINPFELLANIQDDLDDNIRTCKPNELREKVAIETNTDKYKYLKPDAFKTLSDYHKETFFCEEVFELSLFDFNANTDVYRNIVKKVQRHMNVLILKCSRYLERKEANKIRFSVYVDLLTSDAYGSNFAIALIFDPTTGYVFELKMIDNEGTISIITKTSLFYNIAK